MDIKNILTFVSYIGSSSGLGDFEIGNSFGFNFDFDNIMMEPGY